MKLKQTGFTLIEIAIVLVIIGLLLGGILKGQELINSAKVKSVAGEFKNIPIFLYGYQDKFKSLPGDDGAAATHLPLPGVRCSPDAPGKCTVNNGSIDGKWDAPISEGAANESYLFWQHVRLAGFTSGPTNLAAPDYLPVNAAGGTIGIQSNTASFTTITLNAAGGASVMSGAYIICSTGILGKFVKQLDTTLDNGDPDTGAMRTADGATGKSMADNGIVDGTSYTVCMGV